MPARSKSIKIDQVGDKLINDYRLAGDVELRLPQVRNASQAKLDHKRTLINLFVKTVAERIENLNSQLTISRVSALEK